MLRCYSTRTVMQVTAAAAARLKELLSKRPDNSTYIRLGVRKRGCNGLSYTMDYAKEHSRMDEVIETSGIRIVVDAKAVMFVIGTTMDFVNTPTHQEFVFSNPNAKGTCGCGESFNV
jgi:iron-sulfur cluster assembly accessory protein